MSCASRARRPSSAITVEAEDKHDFGGRLAEILRDGFRSCHDPPQAPPAGYDLGWRSGSYDLSAFKGQHVRLIFENRNLHHDLSLGIWTLVDDVRVVDAGP